MSNAAALQEIFSEQHDTGVTRPMTWWHRRPSERLAEESARQHLNENSGAYKETGIKSPAAALYTLAGEYKFAVYDRKETDAENAIPQGTRLISNVTPSLFKSFIPS